MLEYLSSNEPSKFRGGADAAECKSNWGNSMNAGLTKAASKQKERQRRSLKDQDHYVSSERFGFDSVHPITSSLKSIQMNIFV